MDILCPNWHVFPVLTTLSLESLPHRADNIYISSTNGGRSWADALRWPFYFQI